MVKRVLLIVLIGAVLVLGAYFFRGGKSGEPAPGQPTAQTAPPPEVVVAQKTELQFPVDFAGRVAAFRDVEIRPLVGGILLKREFEEGSRVDQGQALFRIDPATY